MAAWLAVAFILICPALARLPCAFQIQELDAESLQAEEQDHKGAVHAARLMRRLARKVVRCSSVAALDGRALETLARSPSLLASAPQFSRLNEHALRNGVGAPLRC